MIKSVYIAAPFFTASQLSLVVRIEELLEEQNIPYFSPRSSGTLIDMTEEERKAAKKEIYDLNIYKIEESDVMIACIDDFDTGTVFEMGYGAARGKRMISTSANGHGLNVMLAEPVQAHTTNLDDVLKALLNPLYQGVEVTGLT